MQYEVGEAVVYPHHCAADISAVKTRVIEGAEKLHLALQVTQGDLVTGVLAS